MHEAHDCQEEPIERVSSGLDDLRPAACSITASTRMVNTALRTRVFSRLFEQQPLVGTDRVRVRVRN